jgi:hypothetical protein
MANSDELTGTTENDTTDELSYKPMSLETGFTVFIKSTRIIHICFDSTCRIIIRGHLINALSKSANDHLQSYVALVKCITLILLHNKLHKGELKQRGCENACQSEQN